MLSFFVFIMLYAMAPLHTYMGMPLGAKRLGEWRFSNAYKHNMLGLDVYIYIYKMHNTSNC